MFSSYLDKVKMNDDEGGANMESTNDFLTKLHDKQQKDEQNRKRQGKNNPSEKLPTNRNK
jgi:hypothetical protein